MIAKMGYPSETHEVITEDGYILQMHRIPFGKKSPPADGVERPAVYLQHGLLCSSADYVMGIPEKSLGCSRLNWGCVECRCPKMWELELIVNRFRIDSLE